MTLLNPHDPVGDEYTVAQSRGLGQVVMRTILAFLQLTWDIVVAANQHLRLPVGSEDAWRREMLDTFVKGNGYKHLKIWDGNKLITEQLNKLNLWIHTDPTSVSFPPFASRSILTA